MSFLLLRTYHPAGTNGDLYFNGVFICHTIELPWLDNSPRRSCIPEGRYEVVRRWSPRHKAHFWIRNVPGRELILIHPANNAPKELKGCIAPVTYLAGVGRGSFSRIAMRLLTTIWEETIEEDTVCLTIREAAPSIGSPVKGAAAEIFGQQGKS